MRFPRHTANHLPHQHTWGFREVSAQASDSWGFIMTERSLFRASHWEYIVDNVIVYRNVYRSFRAPDSISPRIS